jgi:hypothetical protein
LLALAPYVSPDLERQPAENVLAVPLPAVELETPAPALPVLTPQPPTRLDDTPLRWLPTRRWLIHPDGGLPWSVEERKFADGPSLFFVNDAGFVRVRRYPPNWLELPDDALAALLRRPRA